jgi:hypothetical protein
VARWALIQLGEGTDPAAGSSWPVFCSSEPASPDNALTVYDTQGTDDGRSMIDGDLFGHYGVQLKVRSRDHATGWAKADAVQKAMAALYQLTVSIGSARYLVHCFARIGDVLALGQESPTSTRRMFTVNAIVSIRQLA